jgi:hypothetical protein
MQTNLRWRSGGLFTAVAVAANHLLGLATSLATPPKYAAVPIDPVRDHTTFYSNSLSEAGDAHFFLGQRLPDGSYSGRVSPDGSYLTAPDYAPDCEYVTKTGDLVCYGFIEDGSPAYRVNNGSAIQLKTVTGQPQQFSLQVSTSDRVGNIYGQADGVAMQWKPDGTAVALGQMNGRFTTVKGANNHGVYVGEDSIYSNGGLADTQAFIYENNTFSRINIPQLSRITVAGIWDDGTVVGTGVNHVPDYYGNLGRYIWYWKDGNLRFLEGDPEHPVIQYGVDNPLDALYGSNTSGWAIGTSPQGGLLIDGSGNSYYINDLLVDRDLAARANFGYAYAINDSGQIVAQATAFDSPPLTDNWYILTPVPEPVASIPLVAGLALMVRRRGR